MPMEILARYLDLRRALSDERVDLQRRIAELDAALGNIPIAPTPNTRAPRTARNNPTSLKKAVVEALKNGPLSKEAILKRVESSGYKFSTSNPLNSLGVVLYGKTPRFNRTNGKFSLVPGSPEARGELPPPKKRTMSAEGRARVAEAARKRWAELRKAKKQQE